MHAGVTIQYSLGPSSGTNTVNTTKDGYFTIHVLSDKITAETQMITLGVSKMTGSLEHKFLCTGRPCTELFVICVVHLVALRAIGLRLLTVYALHRVKVKSQSTLAALWCTCLPPAFGKLDCANLKSLTPLILCTCL